LLQMTSKVTDAEDMTGLQFTSGKDGEADYKRSARLDAEAQDSVKEGAVVKGVSFDKSVQTNTKIMILTTFLFFIIQIPASILESANPNLVNPQAYGESKWALVGFISCIAGFCGYLFYCYKDANEDKKLNLLIEGVQNHQVSLGAALRFLTEDLKRQGHPVEGEGNEALLLARRKTEVEDMSRLKKVLKPFFAKYDYNRNNELGKDEVKPLLLDLNLEPSQRNIEAFFGVADKDKSRTLSFQEFVFTLYKDYVVDENKLDSVHHTANPKFIPAYDDDEEEEEVPENLVDQDPDVQLKNITIKSIKMMGLGTFLIILFSDPMVECLSEWGKRLNISAFYVSFIVAPFASNASELIAAYNYASKKTKAGITTALSTLVGAACMNNTFCLAIFLALVYFQSLAWQFTAETICCVSVQYMVGILTLKACSQTTKDALIIFACYPVSLVVVAVLEAIGFD